MTKQVWGKVIKQLEVTPDVCYLELAAPEIAEQAKPGQFIHVRCSDSFSPLLRRPISLHEIEPATGRIGLLYQVKGPGTQLMAGFRAGDVVDLLGPLGNGFKINQGAEEILIVGGGIGSAPLLPLAEVLWEKGKKVSIILGFNNSTQLLRVKEFSQYARKLIITTLDGSAGEEGLVTKPLERELREGQYSTVYACGPEPMLQAVAGLAESFRTSCQVSLEAYMACGIGACLGCTCKTRENGQELYSRVCAEGPVFDSQVVVWNE